MKEPAKKSPLERLSEVVQKQTLPVRVKPKSRFKESRVITPIIEEDPTEIKKLDLLDNLSKEQIIITNSSLSLHFNFKVDDKAVDKMIEGSKQAIKGIAAAGAAMLGTAILLGNNKDRVKMPLNPKVKVPKIKK
jgi:hypothetical protein